MTNRETAAEINEIAMRWAVLADDRPLNDHEIVTLEEWLGEDIRKLGAYARAKAGFVRVERAQALGTNFDADAYMRQHGLPTRSIGLVEALASEEPAASVLATPMHRRRLLAGGAGVAAAGTLAALGVSWQAAAQTYSTRRGEVRLVPLADGSTMTLNTETVARVDRGEECRVDLVSGEAMFDIVAKRGRRVVVEAGDVKVCASSSAFSVSRLAGHPVQVLVQQGIAKMLPAMGPPIRREIGAYTRTTIAAGKPMSVTSVSPDETSRSLAWREGKLAFEDVPLREAALEFARYSDTTIAIASPSIGDATVTGLFSANNPVGFAEAVALSLGLSVSEGPGTVELGPSTKKV